MILRSSQNYAKYHTIVRETWIWFSSFAVNVQCMSLLLYGGLTLYVSKTRARGNDSRFTWLHLIRFVFFAIRTHSSLGENCFWALHSHASRHKHFHLLFFESQNLNSMIWRTNGSKLLNSIYSFHWVENICVIHVLHTAVMPGRKDAGPWSKRLFSVSVWSMLSIKASSFSRLIKVQWETKTVFLFRAVCWATYQTLKIDMCNRE